jgi:hypothetical protein
MADLRMNQKFNRKNFVPKFFNEDDGVEELALSDSNWDRYFEVKYPTKSYQLGERDMNRPDLISFNAYKKADYWWIILKFNNVIDPFTELNKVGMILDIPDIKDIQDYYMNVKNRRRVAGGTGRKTSR